MNDSKIGKQQQMFYIKNCHCQITKEAILQKKEICPYPQHTAAWAIYSFYQIQMILGSNFCSMQVGGDTDTCAACCGAIAGAYSGLNLIIKGRRLEIRVKCFT